MTSRKIQFIEFDYNKRQSLNMICLQHRKRGRDREREREREVGREGETG